MKHHDTFFVVIKTPSHLDEDHEDRIAS